MPAARYWRIVGIETYAGGDLELSELHLYGASGRLDATATLTSTVAPAAGALAALQDGNLATTCRFAGAAVRSGGFALVWDFGIGGAADVIGVRPGSAAGPDVFLGGFTLQYRSEGEPWTSLTAYGGIQYPGDFVMGGQLLVLRADLLLHFDDLTDSGGSNKVLTLAGGATLDTTAPVFGNSSLGSRTNNSAGLVPHDAAWDFGSEDFIVDFRFRIDGPITTRNYGIVCHDNIGVARGWLIVLEDGSGGRPAGTLSAVAWAGAVNSICSWGTVPQPGVWYRGSYRRVAGVFELWVQQVKVSTDANHKTLVIGSVSVPLVVGNLMFSGSPKDGSLGGNVDELFVVKGPTSAAIDPSVSRDVPYGGARGVLRVPSPERARIAASAPVPAYSTALAPTLQFARDIEFGGHGTIYGTTKTKGTPNVPTKARVVLLHQRSKLPVRETWSDPVTGAFAFTSIDTTQQFLTLAEDAAGNFRPVAANRLTPEVLP